MLWDALVGGKILVTTVDGINATRTLNLKVLQSGRPWLQLRPVVLWVRPPSLEALEARLRGAARGDAAEAELQSRLRAKKACIALEARGSFDTVIVNDDLVSASSRFRELCRALRPRHRWLSQRRPLGGAAWRTIVQLLNVAKWVALGAEHCDRPRLRRHATEEADRSPRGPMSVRPAVQGRLSGLARSLELIPVAGEKPNVAL